MNKITLFIALLMSNVALARVVVHDNAGVIPSNQKDALISSGSRWPFDLHVLTGVYPTPAALNNAVHRCVTGPNVVCIGLDPVHHKTNVHVGTATGINVDDSVSSAGNSYFRNGDFRDGIEAIASRARDLSHPVVVNNHPVPVVPYSTQPVQVHIDNPNAGDTSHIGLWIFFALIFAGLVAWVIYRTRRNDKLVNKINTDMNDFRDEAFEMSSRNIEQADFHEKLAAKMNADKPKPMMPAPVPAALSAASPKIVAQPVVTAPVQPTTVVHNHYGQDYGYNPTLTGSVMTDVLLADALTRPVVSPAPVVVEREVVREPAYDNGGSSSSWNDVNDNSSSSSSWDNDSSSSSSDWGSSSDSGSSWDSGGGSDSGSSGSDW